MVNPQKPTIKKTGGVNQLPQLRHWFNVNAKNFQTIFKKLIWLKVSKLKMKVFVSYCNARLRLECLLGCLSVSVPLPNGIALLVAIFVLVISEPFHSASHQWFWIWGCWKTWRIFNVFIYCVDPWTMQPQKTNKPLAFSTSQPRRKR